MSKRFQNPFMLCATLVAASAIPALPALADNGAPPPPWNVTMGKCSDWKGSWAMQHVGPGHWIGTSVIKVVGTTCASHSLGYQQTANVEFVTHRDRTWTATTTNTKGGPDCTYSGTVTSPTGASGTYHCGGDTGPGANMLINAPKPFFNMNE